MAAGGMTGLLPVTAGEVLVEHVRAHGAHGVETGGLLLADTSGVIVAVACAAAAGITRHHDLFKINGAALDSLFSWCEARGLRARAIFHSHAGRAFLSATDRELGLNVRGFTSVVLPDFADPPRNPADWAWFTFDGSNWVDQTPWPSARTAVRVLDFDSVVVHER